MKKLNIAETHSVAGGNIIDIYVNNPGISQHCADLFKDLLPDTFNGTIPYAIAAKQIIDSGCHLDYLKVHSNIAKPSGGHTVMCG